MPENDYQVNEKADKFIREQMQRFQIPGVSLSVIKDSKLFYSKGYGIADNTGRAVSPETSFLLASVSKSFTALGIMQLVEDGLLELDAPVKKYIPWFQVENENISNLITVRHLLNQTTGFSNYTGKIANLTDYMDRSALEKYVRDLNNTELINLPGGNCEYSNTNFGILGLIIETISGLTIEEYFQNNIFDPLEMENTFTSDYKEMDNRISMGFYPFFGFQIVVNDFLPYSRTVIPWGGIFSSADDLTNYLIALLNNGEFKNNSIITKSGLEELFKPVCQIDNFNKYAMGWFIQPFFKKYTAIWHDGLWLGYRSFVLLVPERKFGLILLMNSNNPSIESVYSSIGWSLSEIYFNYNNVSVSPSEPFIIRNIRLVLVVIIFSLIATSLLYFFKWNICRKDSLFYKQQKIKRYMKIFLPYFLEILLVVYLIEIMLPQNNTNLLLTIRFAPDIGLLLVIVLFFAIVIGSFRTLFILAKVYKRSSESLNI